MAWLNHEQSVDIIKEGQKYNAKVQVRIVADIIKVRASRFQGPGEGRQVFLVIVLFGG